MWSTGKLIFVVVFIIMFILGMIYAYKEDLKTVRQQYSGVYLVFLALVLFLLILYLLVKVWHKM